MPRHVQFDSTQVVSYEIQAVLFALLAWPEEEHGGARQSEAQVALIAHMFRSAAMADPGFMHRPLTVRPVYLWADGNETTTMARRTYERLCRNMVAIRVLRPFVQDRLFGKDAPPLPSDLKHLSLNAVTEWVTMREAADRDAHKFEEVVRQLYPVLHLGIALEMILQKAERLVGRTPPAEFLMTTPELTKDMIELAEALEPVVLGIERMTLSEETQIRVRLLG